MFNIIDDTHHVFISTSTVLSVSDRQLVPPQYRPEGIYHTRPKHPSVQAHKYFALKVEKLSSVTEHYSVDNVSGVVPAGEGNNITSPRVRHRYVLHMLALNADVIPWAVFSYYMNSKLYFPMVARGLMGALSVPLKKRGGKSSLPK